VGETAVMKFDCKQRGVRFCVTVILVVSVTRCSQPVGNRCGPDLPPCPSMQECQMGECRPFAVPMAGGEAGGTAGGGAGGAAGGQAGGSSVTDAGGAVDSGVSEDGGPAQDAGVHVPDAGGEDAGLCVPACRGFEQCEARACLSRYASVTILAEPRTNQPLRVTAALALVPGRMPAPSVPLRLEAIFAADGSVRVDEAMRESFDGGFELASPLTVATSGVWQLRVYWPDGGPEATTTSEVDLDGPALRLTVTRSVREFIDGGADFRDPLDAPTGPRSYRRHQRVPIRVESSAVDLDAGSLRVLVGSQSFTGPWTECPTDAGVLDGGFCVVGELSLAPLPLRGLREDVGLRVSADDTLGNRSALDGGVITVSRWRYAIRSAASADGGFSLSPTGKVLISTPALNQLTVFDVGRVISQIPTDLSPPPLVGIGQSTFEQAYFVSRASSGESIAEAASLDGQWQVTIGPLESRLNLPEQALVIASRSGFDSVAYAFRNSNRQVVVPWAEFGPTSVNMTGLASRPAEVDAGLSIVASSNVILVTDSFNVWGFQGSTGRSFLQTQPFGTDQATGAAAASSFVGRSGGSAFLLAQAAGAWSVYLNGYPTRFTAWGVASTDALSNAVVGSRFVYFKRSAGSLSWVCRTEVASQSYVCASPVVGEQVDSIAVAEGPTLLVTVRRGGSSFLQFRDGSSLSLQIEVPLPGVVGPTRYLTPTCIAGEPTAAFMAADGTLYFIATDARGVDATAEWPMDGHDPSRTFNSVTDYLVPHSCP
jgi:hypothetical protein